MTGFDLYGAAIGRRAVLSGLTAVATLGGTGCAVSEKGGREMATSMNFDVMRYVRGETYLTLRDRFLPMGAELATAVDQALGDADWERRATATILKGWSQDGDLYRSVNADFDAIDPAFEAKTIVGLEGVATDFRLKAERVWGPQVTPLALEAIMKLDQVLEPWQTNSYLGMLAGTPSETAIEPVIDLMFRTDDETIRWQCGATLAALPPNAVRSRVASLRERSGDLSDVLERLDSSLP